MFLLFVSQCFDGYCLDWTVPLKDVVACVGAIIAFFIALQQYRKSQIWKRKEFMLKYYDNFLNNINVKRGMLMLDWNRIEIPVQNGEIKGKNNFWFDDRLLGSALRIHFEMNEGEGFSDEECLIRLIMDEFLEKLGSYYPLIKAKLIKKEDIVGIDDIAYYIDIIGNKSNTNKNNEIRKQIWKYILSYKFNNISNLCKEFDFMLNIDEI
jgi:hypothetical protein